MMLTFGHSGHMTADMGWTRQMQYLLLFLLNGLPLHPRRAKKRKTRQSDWEIESLRYSLIVSKEHTLEVLRPDVLLQI